MKILVDENIPLGSVQALRLRGHDVVDWRESQMRGAPDEDLWLLAQRDGRLLLTTDKGFSHRRSEAHFGILVVRLKQPNRQKIHQRIELAMSRIAEPEWPGLLVVVRDEVLSLWRKPET